MGSARVVTTLAVGLLLAAAVLAGGPARAEEKARYEPIVTGDGMLAQPWFLQSFLDLQEDLAAATAEGKRFAIFWEQRGCPYCKEMHEVNLAIPAIQEYVREHFEVLQLNLWGAREVTDFDGEVLEERKLARKYGIAYTPTIQFFPAEVEAVAGQPGKEAEVQRMPGYFKPFHYLAMFQYVEERAYEDTPFQAYLAEARVDMKARGLDIEAW